MVIRRPVLALASAALLLASLVSAQPAEQARKLSNDEKKELQVITTLLAAPQPPANDLALAWVGSDLLKAQGNKEYVPFTIALDPSRLTGRTIGLYWRVVSKTAPPPDPKAKKDERAPLYAFENFHVVDVEPGGTLKLSRSFVVPPGDYDLYVVAKEPEPKKKSDGPARAGVLRQAISVPDLWNGELTTSSVIVAERIDPLPAPLTPLQQEERPYALGNMEIEPAAGTRFAKKNELTVFLLIYNARVDASNAPDVVVEYNFYNVANGSEKFFNKTNPQALNAQTLQPGFDVASGMTNGQTIPLASFPEGDYRMEIKITDKLATRSITRDVKFTVTGS
ncbi:MAG: hypothetical protein AB7H96_20490 [Vicinamibacterales bacterium]